MAERTGSCYENDEDLDLILHLIDEGVLDDEVPIDEDMEDIVGQVSYHTFLQDLLPKHTDFLCLLLRPIANSLSWPEA